VIKTAGLRKLGLTLLKIPPLLLLAVVSLLIGLAVIVALKWRGPVSTPPLLRTLQLPSQKE
jgi:hypothetical protein